MQYAVWPVIFTFDLIDWYHGMYWFSLVSHFNSTDYYISLEDNLYAVIKFILMCYYYHTSHVAVYLFFLFHNTIF